LFRCLRTAMEERYGCFAFEGAGSSPSRLKGRDATVRPDMYRDISDRRRFVLGVAVTVLPAKV